MIICAYFLIILVGLRNTRYSILVIVLFIIFLFYVRRFFFFLKQRTAYDMRISEWSSDVCSSDLSFRHCEKSVKVACDAERSSRRERPQAMPRDPLTSPRASPPGRAKGVDGRSVAGACGRSAPRRPLPRRPSRAGLEHAPEGGGRSEERRGGKEEGSTGRSRGAP